MNNKIYEMETNENLHKTGQQCHHMCPQRNGRDVHHCAEYVGLVIGIGKTQENLHKLGKKLFNLKVFLPLQKPIQQ